MFRKTTLFLLLNVSGESMSFRSKPVRNLQVDVAMSPYKEQFKDFWATPVPWQDREYGEKPVLGAPIPTRQAASTIVVAKNKHHAPGECDYKVLFHFREGRGRMVKDQFCLPGAAVNSDDRNTDSWVPVLKRRGVADPAQFPDIQQRICAMRSLLIQTNLLLIPKEGGGIAEVEGPPGPKKWRVMIASHPRHHRDLYDALELPLKSTMEQLLPFRRMITPTTETFRFENKVYLVTFPKVPCVQYALSNVGEQLIWASPQEAVARFNAGIMHMPTPNIILMSELMNQYPTFDDIQQAQASNSLTFQSDAPSILPELAYHEASAAEGGRDYNNNFNLADQKVATVLLPGDMHHSETIPEDRERKYLRRFLYEKDYPFGVRAVFAERPVDPEVDDLRETVLAAPKLLEEANEADQVYADIPYLNTADNRGHKMAPMDGKTLYNLPVHTLRDTAEDPMTGNFKVTKQFTGLEGTAVAARNEEDDDSLDFAKTVPSTMRKP